MDRFKEGKPCPDDTVVLFLPFFHIYGMVVTLISTLVYGVRLVIMEKFDMNDYLTFNSRYKVRVVRIDRMMMMVVVVMVVVVVVVVTLISTLVYGVRLVIMEKFDMNDYLTFNSRYKVRVMKVDRMMMMMVVVVMVVVATVVVMVVVVVVVTLISTLVYGVHLLMKKFDTNDFLTFNSR